MNACKVYSIANKDTLYGSAVPIEMHVKYTLLKTHRSFKHSQTQEIEAIDFEVNLLVNTSNRCTAPHMSDILTSSLLALLVVLKFLHGFHYRLLFIQALFSI